VPYRLFADALPKHSTCAADTAKDLTPIDGGGAEPAKQLSMHPVGHWDRAYDRLANEVHDGPMVFSLLQVFHFQIRCLVSPQSAREEKRQQGAVTFPLHLGVIRTLLQRASLLSREPVSHSDAILLQTLHPPNPGGQIGAEQTTICGLVGQPPNCAQPKVDGPGGQSPGSEMAAIPKYNDPVECQPRF